MTNLGRHKTCEVAVHTFFIFGRLFGVLRQQFGNLTREVCNYLGECESKRSVVAHFLITVDMLFTEFELPKIYLDTELVRYSLGYQAWHVCVSIYYSPVHSLGLCMICVVLCLVLMTT